MPDARLPLRNKRPGDLIYIDNSGEEVVLHVPTALGTVPAYLSAGLFAGIPILPTWETVSNLFAGFTHNLLGSATHPDTVTQTVSRGSLIVGNSTPAWDELIIGGANTVLRSNGTDAGWGTIDNNYIDNRTRYAGSFFPYSYVGAGVGLANDAHGGVIGSIPHVDFPDGVAGQAYYMGPHLPADFLSGTVTLNVQFSSDVAGGNVYMDPFLVSIVSGTTGQLQDPNPGYIAVACNATANRPNTYSVTSSASLVADKSTKVGLLIDRTNVADTNTGVISIWDIWLTYNADS